MIVRNEACLEKLIRQSRLRLNGRHQEYFDRFCANRFHFARDRIAMLALAHSQAGKGVWGLERLIARGLAERPGLNQESLKPPRAAKRSAGRWCAGQSGTPRRAAVADLGWVLQAYVDVRERRDAPMRAHAQFGHFAAVDAN